MKAQKVFENINFERGYKEPSNLGIGKYRDFQKFPPAMQRVLSVLLDTGHLEREVYEEGSKYTEEGQGLHADQFFWDHTNDDYSWQGAKNMWSSLFWLTKFREFGEEIWDEYDLHKLFYEDGGSPRYEASLQVMKIDPNSEAAKYHGGSIQVEFNLRESSPRKDREPLDIPDSFEIWCNTPDEVEKAVSSGLKRLKTWLLRYIKRKYGHLMESYNFERGKDIQDSMSIGKHALNPFRNGTLNYIPFIDIIEERGFLEDEILKNAAEMLKVPESEVLVAVDKRGYPLSSSELNDREWSYSGGEDRDIKGGEYFISEGSDGVLHVVETGEEEIYILGKL